MQQLSVPYPFGRPEVKKILFLQMLGRTNSRFIRSKWERYRRRTAKGQTVSILEESRKFVKLEGCVLHLQFFNELYVVYEDGSDKEIGWDSTSDITVDLSRTRVQLMKCCGSEPSAPRLDRRGALSARF